MNGIGYYKWADGKKYIGEYLNSHKHGYGIYRLSQHRVHHGYWNQGKGHGLGCIETVGQEKKYWLFENGKSIYRFNQL